VRELLPPSLLVSKSLEASEVMSAQHYADVMRSAVVQVQRTWHPQSPACSKLLPHSLLARKSLEVSEVMSAQHSADVMHSAVVDIQKTWPPQSPACENFTALAR